MKLTRVLGVLIPIVVAIMLTSSYFTGDWLNFIKAAAFITSAIQLILAGLVLGLEWDGKVPAYERLVGDLTYQRDSFIHMSAMEETNAGNLYHTYRIESERFRLTLEAISRYATYAEFKELADKLKV